MSLVIRTAGQEKQTVGYVANTDDQHGSFIATVIGFSTGRLEENTTEAGTFLSYKYDSNTITEYHNSQVVIPAGYIYAQSVEIQHVQVAEYSLVQLTADVVAQITVNACHDLKMKYLDDVSSRIDKVYQLLAEIKLRDTQSPDVVPTNIVPTNTDTGNFTIDLFTKLKNGSSICKTYIMNRPDNVRLRNQIAQLSDTEKLTLLAAINNTNAKTHHHLNARGLIYHFMNNSLQASANFGVAAEYGSIVACDNLRRFEPDYFNRKITAIVLRSIRNKTPLNLAEMLTSTKMIRDILTAIPAMHDIREYNNEILYTLRCDACYSRDPACAARVSDIRAYL